ncbi:hypothetical protein SAMN02990966_05922 [Rhodospirillales bacterium URHD0017]|nr:hypothetical protein SAMN02990966_05922 [Rhodospirillales bacterium URHD0017]
MPLRPTHVSKPLVIHQIKLDPAALKALPKEVRRTVLLLGHVANEVNTLSRLLLFSVHKQDHPIKALFAEARSATILRLLIGVTFEGFRAIERTVLRSAHARPYLAHLAPGGEVALKQVKKALSDNKLMAGIRNAYSFHLPTDDQIDAAFVRLPADADMSVYSGEPRHSTLNTSSSLLMTRGILDLVDDPRKGTSRKSTDKQLMKIVTDDVIAKSNDLNSFIEFFVLAIIERENLQKGALTEALVVDTHESVGSFQIPPILRS